MTSFFKASTHRQNKGFILLSPTCSAFSIRAFAFPLMDRGVTERHQICFAILSNPGSNTRQHHLSPFTFEVSCLGWTAGEDTGGYWWGPVVCTVRTGSVFLSKPGRCWSVGGVLICQVASAAPLWFGALGEERGGRRGGRAKERNAVMRWHMAECTAACTRWLRRFSTFHSLGNSRGWTHWDAERGCCEAGGCRNHRALKRPGII